MVKILIFDEMFLGHAKLTPLALKVGLRLTCWFLPDPFLAFSLLCSRLRGLNPTESIAGLLSLSSTEFWLLPKLGLYSPMPTRNRERVLGEVKRSSFYCFARQRGPQWANALKTMWSTLEGLVRSFIVFKEQGVISSWTTLGLVCLKVKFQASPTSLMGCILVVSSFHLAGGAECCFL